MNLTEKDMVPGRVYVGYWEWHGKQMEVIFKYINNLAGSENTPFISTGNPRIFNVGHCCSGNHVSFRPATCMEEAWLNECIRANDTVPCPIHVNPYSFVDFNDISSPVNDEYEPY
jgi:hypothetical protein